MSRPNISIALQLLACLFVSLSMTSLHAQQALIQGERVVSVGRTIYSQTPASADRRPCTVDCEKKAKAVASAQQNQAEEIGVSVLQPPQTTADTLPEPCQSQKKEAERLEARNAELAAQLREMQSRGAHEQKQAADRIDRLSQMLKLSEQNIQQLTKKPKQDHNKLVAEQKAALAESDKQLKAKVSQITEMTNLIAGHKATLEAHAKEMKAKESQLAQMTATATDLKQQLAKLTTAQEKEQKQREAEAVEMRKRIEVAKRQEEEAKKLDEELQTVKEKLEHAVERNEKYAISQKKLEQEIATLKRRQKPSSDGKSPSDRKRPSKKPTKKSGSAKL